jgi:hypothetical protein
VNLSHSSSKALVRYWIYDEDDTPQGFPLRKLVQKVKAYVGATEAHLQVLKAMGFGERVTTWDRLTDETDGVPVNFPLLEEMTVGVEEWFYDIEIECVVGNQRILFGLHDTTALFVVAPRGIADVIVSGFNDVRESPNVFPLPT